jgi:hypothetical protein
MTAATFLKSMPKTKQSARRNPDACTAEIHTSRNTIFHISLGSLPLLLGPRLLLGLARIFLVFLLFLCLFLVTKNLLFIRGNDDVVDIAVKLFHHVDSGVHRQLRVQNTASDAKLLKVELQTVAAVDISDENDAFALDQLKLEDDVNQQKLFVLTTPVANVSIAS